SKSGCQCTRPGATLRDARLVPAPSAVRAFSIRRSTSALPTSRRGSWSGRLARASNGRAKRARCNMVCLRKKSRSPSNRDAARRGRPLHSFPCARSAHAERSSRGAPYPSGYPSYPRGLQAVLLDRARKVRALEPEPPRRLGLVAAALGQRLAQELAAEGVHAAMEAVDRGARAR